MLSIWRKCLSEENFQMITSLNYPFPASFLGFSVNPNPEPNQKHQVSINYQQK